MVQFHEHFMWCQLLALGVAVALGPGLGAFESSLAPSPPRLGLWLIDPPTDTTTSQNSQVTFFDASDVLQLFGSLNKTDPTLQTLMAPTGGAYSLNEKRSLLGSLDLLPTVDTGDVACQGSLNTEAVITMGGTDAAALVAQWLVTVPVDATDGRVWDSSGQQYHQRQQGAWESAAEWIQMARLYAAHSGDVDLFSAMQDRVLCFEDPARASPVNAGGTDAGGAAICALPASQLVSGSGVAENLGTVILESYTGQPFVTRDSPRLQVAGAKRLVQRFTVNSTMSALRLPLLLPRGPTPTLAATVCIADVHGEVTVFNTTIDFNESTDIDNGWLRVPLSPVLGPGVYDVGLTAAWAHRPSDAARPAGWPTRLRSARGGARTETWGYTHTDTGPSGSGTSFDGNNRSCCCVQSNAGNATSLAARLERGMLWQLDLSRRSAAVGGGFGMLVVPDAFYNGVPATGLGTCSASSMWDQVRMGWKSAYINMLFLQSIDAWIELERAGAVQSLKDFPSVQIDATVIRDQVATDIARQLGYASTAPPTDFGFYAWLSCNLTDISGHAVCDRDRPPTVDGSDGQRRIDVQMVADQAYAVALGVGPVEETRQRLDRLVAASRAAGKSGGLVRNNLVPFESVDPRIVSSADKWDPTTSDGFCDPNPDGHMVYAGHCVCRNDSAVGGACWGNFGYNQQNGGRVFATQATLFKAGPYEGAVEDFTDMVLSLRKIDTQLRTKKFSTPLLDGDRGLLRLRIPDGPLRTMCYEMHQLTNTTPIDRDGWGETLCNYYKSVTFGLRTGPKNVLIAFAVGALGVHVDVNGTVSLHGKSVTFPSVGVLVSLPPTIVARWPPTLKGLSLQGVNVGTKGRALFDCNVTSQAATTLTCTISLDVQSS